MSQVKRYMSSVHIVEELKFKNLDTDEINEKLTPFDMKLSDITLEEILKMKHKKIILDEEPPIDEYILNNQKYLHFNPKPRIFDDFIPPPPDRYMEKKDLFLDFRSKPFDIVLVDTLNEGLYTYFWLMVLLIIDILLFWFYSFIQNKLKPLSILKDNMIKLSKGDLKIRTKIEGKDEIAQVANEFDNALKQLKELRDSRNLFLRNIMHELKTPITKGKLITDMYEDCERKFILIRVFQRLEYLLGEFAKIEEFTSGKIQLDKKEYFAIESVEQALDILLLNIDEIDIENDFDLKLNVDFELFSIALKNLIDNAIKYNTNGNPKVYILENGIKIINKGDNLTKPIDEYYKPFNHEYETAQSGLGLGLYITNNIIKIHNYQLNYNYEEGHHIFFIKT